MKGPIGHTCILGELIGRLTTVLAAYRRVEQRIGTPTSAPRDEKDEVLGSVVSKNQFCCQGKPLYINYLEVIEKPMLPKTIIGW